MLNQFDEYKHTHENDPTNEIYKIAVKIIVAELAKYNLLDRYTDDHLSDEKVQSIIFAAVNTARLTYNLICDQMITG